MKLSELQIGTKLEIRVYNTLGEISSPSLVSQFEYLIDNQTAVVAAPIHEGVLYPIYTGAIVDIFFLHKGDLYTTKAKVLKRGFESNIALLNVELTTDIKRIQRRQFFRFECSVPVNYRVESTLEEGQAEEKSFIKSFTKDLGGGGLCIAVENKMELNQIVQCELWLSQDQPVKFTGKIVRSTKLDNPDLKFPYEIGVVFKKIDEKDREKIIKYIFEQQRKLRQKGLI